MAAAAKNTPTSMAAKDGHCVGAALGRRRPTLEAAIYPIIRRPVPLKAPPAGTWPWSMVVNVGRRT